MNDSSNQDPKRNGLRPKRPSELRSQSLRGSRPSGPAVGSDPRATSRARPKGASTPGSQRTKPVSRVRLKALRTTPEGNVAQVSVENENLIQGNVDTAATPLPRMPTESDVNDLPKYGDDENQDATIAQRSGDLLKEVKRQQYAEGILGASQTPDFADVEDNSDKTVVGFALTDELISGSFDEPMISTSATNLHIEEEESSNDEKTMFGVALNLEAGTVEPVTPPPLKPPVQNVRAATALPIPPSPPSLPRENGLNITADDPAKDRLDAQSALNRNDTDAGPVSIQPRNSSSGLRPIPLSNITPAEITPTEPKPLRSSAASIRGATIDRSSMVDLDPIVPAASDSVSPVDSTANAPSGSTAGVRSTPIFAAKSPRPARRSDHGWIKTLALNLLPGCMSFASGKAPNGFKQLAVGLLALVPAMVVILTWSQQASRLENLAISRAWMVGHITVGFLSVLSFEAVRLVSSSYHDEISFLVPRWISVLFVPCLFLLHFTPTLMEAIPAVLEPAWYAAMIGGTVSCLASGWCIVYDVRNSGPTDGRFWAGIIFGAGLFFFLLLFSGMISVRMFA
ncbi:MAG: hypothetical protein VYC39_05100 [Myxococcota bacterium]|nr:hypothetical protein [Myxococcota bacterium]